MSEAKKKSERAVGVGIGEETKDRTTSWTTETIVQTVAIAVDPTGAAKTY